MIPESSGIYHFDYCCSMCILISTQYLCVHLSSTHSENRFCLHLHIERVGRVEKAQHFLVKHWPKIQMASNEEILIKSVGWWMLGLF